MVDQEIFSRRLAALDDYLQKAQRLGEISEIEFKSNPAVYDLAERYLHLATESAIDLANHWIADRSLRTPESNRDTFSVLEESGEIDPALAERLRGWAGFRNLLVHQYANLDHGVSYQAIQEDLEDLRALREWGLGKL